MSSNYYIKEGVELIEFKIHSYVYNLNIVNTPKIIKYDASTKQMTLQKIIGSNLSDIYGENADNVPSVLFNRVREIVITLTRNNIEYPDITGYNFMLDNNNKLWIIDFGHAKYNATSVDTFVKEFNSGTNKWNAKFC